MKRVVLAAALVAALVAPSFAAAQYNAYGGQQTNAMSPAPRGFSAAPEDRYKRDVKKLRDDAVRMQKADGGKLSDAHKGELQARLDRLNQEACAKGVKAATCPAQAAN